MDVTQKFLTAGDVAELSGWTVNKLHTLVTHAKALEPVVNGEGQGNFWAYSPLDAVAAAYGKVFYDVGQYDIAAEAVRLIANTSPATLKKLFDKGKTLLITIPGIVAEFMEPGPKFTGKSAGLEDRLNLAKVYDRVIGAVENALARKPSANAAGRSTGLTFVVNSTGKKKKK